MRLIDDAGILSQQTAQASMPRLQLEDDAGVMTRRTITPADVVEGAYKEMGGGSDVRARKFIPQFTKALYDNLPAGKNIISVLPNSRAIKQIAGGTPEPQGLKGNVGSLAGLAAAYSPAYMAGEGLVPAAGNTLKLLAGSAGIGAQDTIKASSEGKSNMQALQAGGLSAGATFVGGKLLGAAGKAIGNTTNALRGVSARISDWIVKLPKKSFSYSKNPMEVFTKENIVANNIGDYAKKAESLLELRTNQLNEAIKSNPVAINIKTLFDDAVIKAKNLANSSLKDRAELLNGIEEMQKRVVAQYGDLSKISIPEAVRLKRQIASDFPFSALESKSSTNNLLSKIGHEVHHNINTEIERVAPNITELNQRVSGLIDIQEAARNRAIVESRNNPIGLIGTILGTGVAGGVAGAASGREPIKAGIETAIAVKVLSSPAVLTRVAKILSKASNIDRIAAFKAYPFLAKYKELMGYKPKVSAEMPVQQKVLGLPAPSAPLPKYLQERQNIPSLDTLAARGSLENPIGMGAPKEPLALPAPQPAYIKQRQELPIPSLGVNAGSNVLQPMKEPIQMPAPLHMNKDAATTYQMLLSDARKAGNKAAEERYIARIAELKAGGKVKSLNDLIKKSKVAPVVGGTLLGLASSADASTKAPEMTDKNAILTIIGEAENQGKDGMRAVASTIRNRKTLKGAYGLHSSRVVGKKYSQDTYNKAKQAWEESKNKDYSGGSNHWFSDADLKQDNVKKMIKRMKLVKRVGTQSFYVE